ncbi:MAG: hypothetical protein K2X01_11415 [Cyanobacteria bacterium]|nr:hypothetical protein [Cyanobacteriota bacterium]
MPTQIFSVSNATGGLNLRASERSLLPNEALDLMNVELTKNGGVLKSNGYIRINTAPISGSPKITGMFYYVKANGAKYTLVTAGTGLYLLGNDGSLTQVYSSLANGIPCFFATFNDVCIIVNGVNHPLVYDGTTVTNLPNWTTIETTGYPSLVEVWKNRLWLSGNPEKPYRLYWSEPGNHGGWTTAGGAGSVDVNRNDGQKITGIKTYFDSLAIYKERSIHQLIGDAPPGTGGPNEFRLRPISTDIGCVAPKTIINVGNDQYFLAEDQVASLKTTNAFGDVNTQNISYKIQPILTRINRSFVKDAFILHQRSKDQIWLFYPDGVSDRNNKVVIYDYGLGAWTQRNGLTASDGVVIDSKPYTGTYDGNIHQQDFGGNYNGSPIVAFYKTPWYGFGDYARTKRIRSVDMTVLQYGNWNLQVQTAFDYQSYSSSFNVNLAPTGQSALWGIALWNQASWSNVTARQSRKVSDIGMGKVFQVHISNSGANQPFHVLGWDVAYQFRGLRP